MSGKRIHHSYQSPNAQYKACPQPTSWPVLMLAIRICPAKKIPTMVAIKNPIPARKRIGRIEWKDSIAEGERSTPRNPPHLLNGASRPPRENPPLEISLRRKLFEIVCRGSHQATFRP